MVHLCQAILDALLRRLIEDVDAFLAPPSWANMPSSSMIEGLDDAVRRLARAVQRKDHAIIYGDYVERAIMLSCIVHNRKNAARCVHFAPHNPRQITMRHGHHWQKGIDRHFQKY